MKRLFQALVPATLMAVGTACSDYDNGFTEQDLKYIQDFKAKYGDIDGQQDWNLAERTSVTVTLAKNADVKVYALVDGQYALVGDYLDVASGQTLGIDVPEGVEKLIVTDGLTAQATMPGGSVNFAGTKTTYDGNGTVKVSKITDEAGVVIGGKTYPKYKYITDEDYQALADKDTGALPEIGARTNYTNLNKVTHDFQYVSTGKFVIYPYYWVTDRTNTIGIYYYENGTLQEVKVYTTKSGSELQYLQLGDRYWTGIYDQSDPRNARDYDWAAAGYTADDFKPASWEWVEATEWQDGYYNLKEVAQVLPPATETWTDMACQGTPQAFTDNGAAAVRAQGIVVDLPEGTVFGMYMETDNGFKCYSQSQLNTSQMCGPGVTDDGLRTSTSVKNDDSIRPSYASTFHVGDQMFLGFEDWPNAYKDSDMDFNDVVLAFSGATPTIINEDPKPAATWILACEDLGGTFDGDYNDLVLKVEHVSGREQATLTPLAAGGTLASYIFFEDPTSTSAPEVCFGEVHQLFGASPALSGAYTPVNVGASRGSAGQSKTFTVGKDWTMARYTSDEFAINSQYSKNGKEVNMGGFGIRVLPSGAQPLQGSIYSTNSAFGAASVVAAPGMGNVPEMLCIPYSYTLLDTPAQGQKTEVVWAWSRELQTVADGAGGGSYPGFADWTADHTKSRDWYKHPNGNTVSRLEVVTSMGSDATAGDDDGGDDELESNIPYAAGKSFTYTDKDGNTTTYYNATFIDFSNVDAEDGYTATLTLTFKTAPGVTLYWDYADGRQLIDDYGTANQSAATLTLTATQLHLARKTGGIYVVGVGDKALNVTSANIVTTYGDPIDFGDEDYGTQVLTSIIPGTSTVPASYFADAKKAVYLTFLFKGNIWQYVRFHTGADSSLVKDTGNQTLEEDTYITYTISESEWLTALKTYGITEFSDWNTGGAKNIRGLWVRCE